MLTGRVLVQMFAAGCFRWTNRSAKVQIKVNVNQPVCRLSEFGFKSGFHVLVRLRHVRFDEPFQCLNSNWNFRCW